MKCKVILGLAVALLAVSTSMAYGVEPDQGHHQHHPLPATPYGPRDAATWHRILVRQCPGHHIDEWMPERNKADLIDEFEAHLSSNDLAKLAGHSDDQTCDNAEGDGANSCDAIVEIHDLEEAHLLKRFSDYACVRFTCSEPAVCDRSIAAH